MPIPALALAGTLLFIAAGIIQQIISAPDDAGLMAIVSFVLNLDDAFAAQTSPESIFSLLGFVVLLCSGIAYVTIRFGARVWVFWARLRRRHLIWSITHSHLMLVVGGVVFLAALVTLNWLQYITEDQPEGASLVVVAALNLVPIFIVFGVMAVILLVVVLPPSVAVSYFAARRTTRRLKSLTQATGALRAGDYAVRVGVVGEDEMAQLQTDFNAMADALEKAMRDLQSERDAVAALLRSRRELVAAFHELRTPVAVLRGLLNRPSRAGTLTCPPELRRDLDDGRRNRPLAAAHRRPVYASVPRWAAWICAASRSMPPT
jgi:HAMP domain-containing protein